MAPFFVGDDFHRNAEPFRSFDDACVLIVGDDRRDPDAVMRIQIFYDFFGIGSEPEARIATRVIYRDSLSYFCELAASMLRIRLKTSIFSARGLTAKTSLSSSALARKKTLTVIELDSAFSTSFNS